MQKAAGLGDDTLRVTNDSGEASSNSPTAEDLQVTEEVLNMSCREINNYFRQHNFTEAKMAAVRKLRRKRKNRMYAYKSRVKKQEKLSETLTAFSNLEEKVSKIIGGGPELPEGGTAVATTSDEPTAEVIEAARSFHAMAATLGESKERPKRAGK